MIVPLGPWDGLGGFHLRQILFHIYEAILCKLTIGAPNGPVFRDLGQFCHCRLCTVFMCRSTAYFAQNPFGCSPKTINRAFSMILYIAHPLPRTAMDRFLL